MQPLASRGMYLDEELGEYIEFKDERWDVVKYKQVCHDDDDPLSIVSFLSKQLEAGEINIPYIPLR